MKYKERIAACRISARLNFITYDVSPTQHHYTCSYFDELCLYIYIDIDIAGEACEKRLHI